MTASLFPAGKTIHLCATSRSLDMVITSFIPDLAVVWFSAEVLA